MAVTFVNIKQTVAATTHYKRLNYFRVAFGKNISYFVFNHSFTNPAIVRILISPDSKIWLADGLEIQVQPRETAVLVPNYFSRYSTLEYRSKGSCHPVKLDIWFQMTRPSAADGLFIVDNTAVPQKTKKPGKKQ